MDPISANTKKLSEQELRDAHLSKNNRKAYRSCINVLAEWATKNLQNPERFTDENTDRLNPRTFEHEHFAAFCTAHSAE
ncbi:hypothetical protein BBJ28_00019303 [Nothophytophthora sp. Chile5]|nr:hypothetical protein BBJ28_00019303 [Nothophytophthora sp. Chile5]